MVVQFETRECIESFGARILAFSALVRPAEVPVINVDGIGQLNATWLWQECEK